MEFKIDLQTKIKARYPIISIATHEELRLQDLVVAIAEKSDKAVWAWTRTDGLVQITGRANLEGKVGNQFFTIPETGETIRPLDYEEPIKALKTARAWASGQKTIFLFKGLGLHLLNSQGNIASLPLARLLKDIGIEYPGNGRENTLILCDPDIVCPRELEKEISVLDMPLPGRDELKFVVDKAVSDSGVVNDLRNGVEDKVIRSLSGMTEMEAEAVLRTAIVRTKKLDASAIPFITDNKAQVVRKSGIMEFISTGSLDETGGADLAKEYVKEVRATFTSAAAAYGVKRVRAVLLTGIPGTGKSLLSRAFAGDEMILLNANMSNLKGSLVGESEKNTRAMFKLADAMAPDILRMDEAEKVFGRVSGHDGDSGTSKAMFGQLLTYIAEGEAPVLTLMTANWPDQLEPELLSRFDRIIFFDAPVFEERIDILKIHLAKCQGTRKALPADFDLAEVAAVTRGYVGRELERIVHLALRRGLVDGCREIDTKDLMLAAQEVKPLCQVMPERIAQIKEWGEMHAKPASSKTESGDRRPAKSKGKAATRKIELED